MFRSIAAPSVFFGATLPSAAWIADEDLGAGVDGDLQVLGIKA